MRSLVGLVLGVSPILSWAQNHDCRAWTGVYYQYCSGLDLELLPDSTYFFCAGSHPGVFGNPGGYRGFVGRLDANLELTQAEAVPIAQPVGYYGLHSLALKDDGGIIAVGEHLNQGIIHSFNSSLDLQWTRIVLDTLNETWFNSVERTLDGNFVAGGVGPSGALVVKFDSLGQLIWSREFQYMYSGTEVSELLEAPNGDLVLIGFCGVGGWTTGWKDVQVHRLDSAGNLLWHTELGTQHSEEAYGGALTANGDIIVVGNTHEVFFEEQTGKAFVLSLNATGQVNWQKTFDKPNGSQELRDAIVLDDGTIVCAGMTDTLATGYGLIIEMDSTGAVTHAMTLKGSGAYEAAMLFTLAPRFGGGWVTAGRRNTFANTTWNMHVSGSNPVGAQCYDCTDPITMIEGPGFVVAPISGTAIQGVTFGPMAMTSVDVTDMYDPCVTSMSEMESRSLTPLLLTPSLVERGMPVRITLPHGEGTWQCTVAGASTGTVLRQNAVQDGASLPTDGLAPGIYVVTVSDGARRYSARFVVV